MKRDYSDCLQDVVGAIGKAQGFIKGLTYEAFAVIANYLKN